MTTINKTLVLFDVDGTLTQFRLPIKPEISEVLTKLKEKVTIGLVGGSDLPKIAEQMGRQGDDVSEAIDDVIQRYDYVFAENGLVAYKNGSLLAKESIVNYIGEQKLQKLINYCLGYMSSLELPVKRGNFVEFRNGLINICPVGRSCSQKERDDFGAYDAIHKIREKFIKDVKQHFGDELDLNYAIGGQISFDCFPKGWDKTFCLKYVEKDFDKIYFFGDKTQPGGNDHEIYSDPRTIGHSVKDPNHTIQILKQLFFNENK
ncbi:uncharacterized protein LOC128965389 [Oppia nitens]|uniref:uncharacterized protein LOC128965389 n=1 Tax=Oppia nitens TaxID=1686743 RepID=UPI0023DC9E60|nr:uncharacterized protein LOC128965389 [Oppia nitens]